MGLSKNKNPSMAQGQMYSLFSHSSFQQLYLIAPNPSRITIVLRSIINPLCNIVSYIKILVNMVSIYYSRTILPSNVMYGNVSLICMS